MIVTSNDQVDRETMVGMFFPDRLRIESQQSLDEFLNYPFSDDEIADAILGVHYFYTMRHHPERELKDMVLELTEEILQKNQMVREVWNPNLRLEDHRLLREKIREPGNTALSMLHMFPLDYLLIYGI